MATLDRMRSGSQNFLIYIAFGILIVVFTFYFGPGTDGCQPSQRVVAASVHGTDIYNGDVGVLLNRVARQGRVEDAEYVGLQKKSLERLALLHLLADKAGELGFTVSDDELRKFIQDKDRNPEFQIYSTKEGRFDPELYQRFVRNGLEVPLGAYEAFKRKELMARKYLTVLEESMSPLPADVDAINALRSTKVNLEFIELDPETLKEGLTFSQAEADAYLQANSDELQKVFEADKTKYETPKEVKVHRIMIKKAAPSATEAEKAQAEEKWTKVKQRVMEGGEDFAAVATDVSEDIVYKDKGGDMGWSKLADMNQRTASIIEKMGKGEVKEDDSNFAYFLLKLDDVKEAVSKSFDEVKGDMARDALAKGAGEKQLNETANALLEAAKKDPTKGLGDALADLREAAEKSAAKPAPGEPPAGDAANPADAAEPTPAPEEQEPVKTVWSMLKAAETGLFSREPRKTFKFDPVKGIVPAAAAWSEVPRIGDNKELAAAAFTLTAENPIADKVHNVGDKAFVVRLVERKVATPEELTTQKAAVSTELNRELVNAYLGTWQSILYRPDAELETVSPWLAKLYADAIASGEIVIEPNVFVVPQDLALPSSEDVTDKPVEPAPETK